jgi:phosphate starvation-inducible PhoH-like protein
MAVSQKITRKQRRLSRQQKSLSGEESAPLKRQLELKHITPLTETQRVAFEAYDSGKNLVLHGIAGTGKSFISLYLALDEILNCEEESVYEKVIIIRSVVPTRDVGFLPGSPKQKTEIYEAPYLAICSELFGRATLMRS